MLAARKMSSDSFFFTGERYQLVIETLKAIAQRNTVYGLSSIYHGNDADIYQIVYPRRKTAVKITPGAPKKDGNALWGGLDHRNVLRMLDWYTLTVLDVPVTVYAMPYKQRSLAEVIGAKSFGLQHGDYPRTKEWVRQVLSGLKYLHSKGLCHLNVTVDNVVFTSKFRAQICDFDSLKKVGDSIERSSVGLPWWFLPPEAEVSGRETDLWSFGLLVIDCITKLTVANGDPTPERSWEVDVFPRMRHILQVCEFSKLVRRAFSASDIPDKELLRALDFVHGFLHTDPGKRTPAARAKEHPYLGGKKHNSNGTRDSAWESPVVTGGDQSTPDDAAVHREDAEPTSLEAIASDKPIIEQVPIVDPSTDDVEPTVEQATTDTAVLQEDADEQTSLEATASDKSIIEQVVSSTDDVILEGGDGPTESTPKATPDDKPTTEPVSRQFNDHELNQLAKCVNRLIRKAVEEFLYKDLKPQDPDASDVAEESSQCSVEDSNVQAEQYRQTRVEDSNVDVQQPTQTRVKDSKQPEGAPVSKPIKEEVLDDADRCGDPEPEPQGNSGSVEREEYSYFNLRSLELSSRFDSSKNETQQEERVRFKALRRTFSRVVNFFGKRK